MTFDSAEHGDPMNPNPAYAGKGSGIEIEHVPINELKPAGYNPRTMTEEARKRLTRSLEEFGFIDPIIARRSDKLVIGGHQRLFVAKQLNFTTAPVIFLENIDDDRAAALNIALNNRALAGDWDYVKLTDILSELDAHGFDATLTGFDDKDLAKFLGQPGDGGGDGDGDGAGGLESQWICIVECKNERDLAELHNRLTSEGYACKLMT